MCGEVYKKRLDESKKFLFITSAIGLILGTIIGVSIGLENVGNWNGIYRSHGYDLWYSIFTGIWFGIGGGVALSYSPFLPVLFRGFCRDEGFIEALKSTLGGSVFWFFIFMLLGPIGFIIRLFRTW